MPRKPGDGKGRLGGRTKGTPNKRSLQARELAEKLNVDPLEVLLRMCKRDWEGLGYESETVTVVTMTGTADVPVIGPDLQIKAAKEAVKYIYPALKSIEHKGDAANLLQEMLAMDPEERRRKIEELRRRRVQQEKTKAKPKGGKR